MKILQKMLLINWHYLRHEIIDFKQINFLTGKNGAGKSTIIDALQLVLLGDTSGYYFNKAANDKSSRTLRGYLRGEIAEDEETNTIYLRQGDFSSYLVLEFKDTGEGKTFCLGVVFDSYQDGDYKHQFFHLKTPLPEHHFYQGQLPMNIKSLKAYFSNSYPKQYQFFESNKDYQEVMRGILGHLNEKFYRLFRKAVPFSPIMDIKGFITEFVCDVQNTVDITDMQENIRQYKQLEEELAEVEKRINALEGIAAQYQTYREEEERLRVQKYLLDRALVEKKFQEIRDLEQEIRELGAKTASLSEELERQEKALASLVAERDGLYAEKIQSDVYRKQQELSKEKEHCTRLLEELKGAEGQLSAILEGHYRSWREVIRWSETHLRASDGAERPTPPDLKSSLELLNRASRQSYQLLNLAKLNELKTALVQYADGLNEAYWGLETELKGYREEMERLSREIDGLKEGIKPYPASLLELRDTIGEELATRYNRIIKPRIFADLLEIRDPKWQKAVEGYLHTQKFYLLIEPLYFQEALEIYDSLKFTRYFYDLGLVDIEKVMGEKAKALPGSLAEEVETADPLARAYADFLLGRVMKCEKLEDLRKHRTAITPSCMLYHNFVARQLHPQRFETPYIGKQAIAELIRQKEQKLLEVKELAKGLEPRVRELNKVRNTPLLTENDITTLLNLKAKAASRPEVEEKLEEVIRKLGALDLSYLVKLEEKFKACETQIQKLRESQKLCFREMSTTQAELKMKEAKLPELASELEEQNAYLEQHYESQWLEEVGEPRFHQELKNRKNPASILAAFAPVVKGTETKRNGHWDRLVELRTNYNRDFKGSFSVTLRENFPYEEELTRLKETFLLEYKEKIREAKERAQTQFQEDFVSKLRANIENAREQIGDLNKAIKDTFFGRDKYKFTVMPRAEYRHFYDMIMDDMLVEGFTLFSNAFQEKYKDTVEELFRQIVDTGEGVLTADQRQELAKNLEKFTDYRTYLDFDLVNIDDEGRESRLSRVITKKSGGETQTPFYIAVLASFMQLYRVKDEESNTLRLIVFDEAYSKMDHQRIQESIRLIRDMGLQVILSAPTEKIGDIAPLVDRNLCVTRVKRQTIVKAFDPREIMEMGA